MPRGRSLQVGGAFFTAAALMYFGSLFAIYLSERAITWLTTWPPAAARPWIPASADVQLTAPTIMAWTLLISIVPMQWAVWSFKRNDRRHGLLALLIQAVFAGAVINQTVFQWNQLGLVADDSSSNAAVLIYAITGSFVAAMTIALIAMALAAFRAFRAHPLPNTQMGWPQ